MKINITSIFEYVCLSTLLSAMSRVPRVLCIRWVFTGV